jgi:hypothetical protein
VKNPSLTVDFSWQPDKISTGKKEINGRDEGTVVVG